MGEGDGRTTHGMITYPGDLASIDPGIINVLEDVDYVIDGEAKTGTYHPALVDEVKYGIEFGPNGSLTGNFPPLVAGTSFTAVIAAIKAVLENDPHLQAYAQSKWRKDFEVMTVFKHRTEINLSDMPVIMLTRPDVKKSSLIGGDREGEHTVRLYCLFNEDDRLKAQEALVELDEKIDDALTAPYPWEVAHALEIKPRESINDEGNYHPSYGLVMDVEITHDR